MSTDRTSDARHSGGSYALGLAPDFVPLRVLPAIEVEAIRQKIHDDYLPVYLDATGLEARVKRVGVRPAASDTRWKLSGFWRIYNDPASQVCDGGLLKLHRQPDEPQPIWFVSQQPPWPEIPGSDLMVLCRPARLSLLDLFIRPLDMLAEPVRENRHADKREQCLRVALAVLGAGAEPDGVRIKSSRRINANALAKLIEQAAPKFWPETRVPPLQTKELENVLRAALAGEVKWRKR